MHEARAVHLGFAAPTRTISRPRSLPWAISPYSAGRQGSMRRSLQATRELPLIQLSSLSQAPVRCGEGHSQFRRRVKRPLRQRIGVDTVDPDGSSLSR